MSYHLLERGFWLVNVLSRVACADSACSTIVPRPSGARALRHTKRDDGF